MKKTAVIIMPILVLSLFVTHCASYYREQYDFYYRISDWESAEKVLLQGLTSDPNDPEIYFLLGQVYGHAGDFAKMDSSFERAVSISKRYTPLTDQFRELFDLEQMKKGIEAYNLGNFQLAVDELSWIKTIMTDETRHYKYLGLACSKLGDYKEAEINLELAVDRTDDLDAKIELARVFHATGESQRVLDITGEVLQSFPADTDLLTLRAMAYERLGLSADAISTYYDILAIEPDFTAARYNLALLLSRTERKVEAIPHFERLSLDDPDNARLKYRICSLLYETEQYEECLSCFSEYLSQHPGDRETLKYLFVLNRKLENWEDAKRIRQQLKNLDPAGSPQ